MSGENLSLQKVISNKIKAADYHFSSLSQFSKEKILKVFKSFSKQLNPIYWSQKESFLKLLDGNDRDHFILEHQSKPIGVLAFKNSPQKEILSLENNVGYLELKSLFLFDDFWKGHIWKIWELLLQQIHEKYNNLDGVVVSVSKNKASWSLSMFQKLGFKELYEVYNKYTQNWDSEVFLYLPLQVDLFPKTYELPVYEPYFSSLMNGEKTTEWRTGKSYEKYKNGDSILFKNKWKVCQKTIRQVIKYPTLEAYLEQEWVENCLPWVKTTEEAIQLYQKIPKYKEKIKKYWMVAFRF